MEFAYIYQLSSTATTATAVYDLQDDNQRQDEKKHWNSDPENGWLLIRVGVSKVNTTFSSAHCFRDDLQHAEVQLLIKQHVHNEIEDFLQHIRRCIKFHDSSDTTQNRRQKKIQYTTIFIAYDPCVYTIYNIQ